MTSFPLSLIALAFGVPPALATMQPPASGPTVWHVERDRDPMTDAPTFLATLPADQTSRATSRPPVLVVACTGGGGMLLAVDAGDVLAPDVGERGLHVRVRYDSAPVRPVVWRVKAGTGFAMTPPQDGPAAVATMLRSRGVWIAVTTAAGDGLLLHFNTMRAPSLGHDLATNPSCRRRA